MKYITLALLTALVSFTYADSPKTTPVKGFKPERYLGKWYEIARLDHSFERGCDYVTAEYSTLDEDNIRVINSCTKEGKTTLAKGRAYFKDGQEVGHLRVTFFWPFFGDYRIITLGEQYDYALIEGGSFDYLWILSRKPKLDETTLNKLLQQAKEIGYDTDKLIYPKQ